MREFTLWESWLIRPNCMPLALPQHNPCLGYLHCSYALRDNATMLQLFSTEHLGIRWKQTQMEEVVAWNTAASERFPRQPDWNWFTKKRKKKALVLFTAVDKEAREQRKFHMGHWAEVKINGPTWRMQQKWTWNPNLLCNKYWTTGD